MKEKVQSSKIRWCNGILLIITLIMIAGCGSEAPKPKDFNSAVEGPQLIVEPDVIRLGVAKLVGTEIIFRGKGFDPDEKIMVVLSGNEEDNREVSIPVGFGKTDENGLFKAIVEKREKIFNILRADVNFGEKGASIVIMGPPIPTGMYTAEAFGYNSEKKATCLLTFNKPTVTDQTKDWLGSLLGKIEYEEGIPMQ
jgi:hypothetical protein